jgi:hypothetical protein
LLAYIHLGDHGIWRTGVYTPSQPQLLTFGLLLR